MISTKKIIIAIGSDHRGYAMKEFLKKNTTIAEVAIEWLDVGAHNDKRSDYPPFAIAAAKELQEKRADYGILICGSGIGMAITANRYPGVYAGLAWNEETARLAKEHDNANVLVLPSDYIDNDEGLKMVKAWINAEFNRGRYARRIEIIDAIKL
jgi:ribose 5-phosphate isomerase B